MSGSSLWVLLALAVGAAVVGGVAVWWIGRTWRRFGLRRRFQRGQKAEARAARLLVRAGYEILGEQVEAKGEVEVDGEIREFPVRGDYLVAKRGKNYVAEVKSGKRAPRVSNAKTRRQLFEYLWVYPVDGVLLVDMEEEAIHEVRWPGLSPRPRTRGLGPLVLGVVVGGGLFLVGVVVGWWWGGV